jgi:chromosomal replication initiation ATPase DnaA
MPLHPIGHISDLAQDTNPKPLATLPLSAILKIEREELFGNRTKKPRGRVRKLNTAELYEVSERVIQVVAQYYEISVHHIHQRQSFARHVAITICYQDFAFTMTDIAFIFNCDRKLPIIAARNIKHERILDPNFNEIYLQLIRKAKA